tara:strand:+ start:6966 stop:7538 length:573 start_codon:yes stop_codon:yes gene_type:complete
MKINEFIKADCYRVTDRSNLLSILKLVFFGETFKYLFWMRVCWILDRKYIFKVTLFPFSKLMLNHYRIKYGISVSYRTCIGLGLYLPHFGGIVINDHAILGCNLVVSQGVTIGKTERGRNKGVPIIGDNVFIGANAVIVGGIVVGNNVLIAPNSFVDFDVKDNSVVVGNPGKVVSTKGASEYIKKPWPIK